MAEIEELKALFGTEALTYDQLNAKMTAAGSSKINLVNLAGGNYISNERHIREVEDAKKAGLPADYEELKAKAAYEQKYNELVAANERKERLNKVTATGKDGGNVRAEFADFVLSEVEKTVTKEKNFDTALAEYVKEHPQYTSKQKNVVKLGSGVKEQSGGAGTNSEKKGGFFNDLLLGNLDI